MSWLVILGGLLGLLFGGFRGLVLGALIGYGITWALPRLLRRSVELVHSQLLDSTFAAMGALSKADEVVTRDEIRAAEAVFDRMGLSAEQRKSAKAAFNRGKAPDFDLDAEMDKLAAICRGRSALLGLFLQAQLMAVAADGQVHPAEHEMLVRMARRLGISEADVARLEAALRAGAGEASGAPSASRLDDAYEALGVSPSASDAQIKRAYRRLMSENHPDKLAGKGLPENMREIAEERTREITEAYRLITEARGKR
ncbi:MAG: co-chaperone DjlA [Pseudomonadota bacterium]